MLRVLFLFLLISYLPLSATNSEVPKNQRDFYASNLYHAFVLQSLGKSTHAFYQFEVAYQEAKKAGESIQKLMVIQQLFEWYRMYGSCLNLFYKKPTGHDKIIGEHSNTYSRTPNRNSDYRSEWGKTPKQAAHIREFMFGVGEAISGVLCASISTGLGFGFGAGLFLDGSRRMFLSLNNVWAEHEALSSLRAWEENAKQVVDSN